MKMKQQMDIDGHKLMYHPDRLIEFRNTGDCYPIYVEFGIASGCNHRCVFCAVDYFEYAGKLMDTKLLLDTLKDMADHGVKSIMLAGEGEPLIHKDIGLIVQKAKEFGLDISITTNGVLLNEDKAKQILPYLSWIRFSFNGGNAENYAKMHGIKNKGEFDKLINNIRNAVKLKKELNLGVTLGVQSVCLSENAHLIEGLARLLKEIGVDNFQLKPYSHHPLSKNNYSITDAEWESIGENLKRLEDENFSIVFRSATKQRIAEGITFPKCFGNPFFALVDANGDIMTCNLFYNRPDYIYGNLNKNTFSEIWQSDKRKQVIAKLMDEGTKNCRNGCRINSVNRFLHRLEQPLAHDNFI
jgi:GTP 3',8-cyclase